MGDIKDFLLTNEDIKAAREQKDRPDRMTEYTYSVEASTDTDIVIRKTSKTRKSTSKLVLLMSEDMYYILKGSGKSEGLTKLGIRNFFRQYPGEKFETNHPIWDTFFIEEYEREWNENSILFMTCSRKFYTDASNSFVPLSSLSQIVKKERYSVDAKRGVYYNQNRKISIEKALTFLNSEIGRYTVEKIMEKEGKTKSKVLWEICNQKSIAKICSEKYPYQWEHSLEQMKCYYDIWRIWPAAATKFVDSWIASEDFSLSSDCIAHVVFAVYSDDIKKNMYEEESYAVKGRIDQYMCNHDLYPMVYPFDREADKFIDFMFNESRQHYMNDRLVKWCELWCQDLSMQKDLYGEIKEPYPGNLPIHVLKMHQMHRSHLKSLADMPAK